MPTHIIQNLAMHFPDIHRAMPLMDHQTHNFFKLESKLTYIIFKPSQNVPNFQLLFLKIALLKFSTNFYDQTTSP